MQFIRIASGRRRKIDRVGRLGEKSSGILFIKLAKQNSMAKQESPKAGAMDFGSPFHGFPQLQHTKPSALVENLPVDPLDLEKYDPELISFNFVTYDPEPGHFEREPRSPNEPKGRPDKRIRGVGGSRKGRKDRSIGLLTKKVLDHLPNEPLPGEMLEAKY